MTGGGNKKSMKNLKQKLELKLKVAQKAKKVFWEDWLETKDEGARAMALEKLEREKTLKEVLELLEK